MRTHPRRVDRSAIGCARRSSPALAPCSARSQKGSTTSVRVKTARWWLLLDGALLASLAVSLSAPGRAGAGIPSQAAPPTPREPSGIAREQQDFLAANELALKGDLAGAISLYLALLQQGVGHEDLYFNLGNAYAESGQLLEAIVSYERGLRLAPGDPDLSFNLGVVRAKSAALDEPSPTGEGDVGGQVVLADVIEPFLPHLPLPLFSWIAVAASALLFASLIARRRTSSEASGRATALLLTISLVALALASATVAGHFVVARDPRAVVLASSEMKEGPHARFKASGRVARGARVRVIQSDAGWVRVLQQDGTTGWLSEKEITRL